MTDREISVKANGNKNILPKKILNRSIFVAPISIPNCSAGFRLNHIGKCEEIVEIDTSGYDSFILDKIFGYQYEEAEYEDYDYRRKKDVSKEKNLTKNK